ncbi:hypothetical protein HDU99_009739, partial [Rhizoclosmatium hyalinum]
TSAYFFLALAFWSSLAIISYRAFIFYGKDFVDRPRLVREAAVLGQQQYVPISEKPSMIYSHKGEGEIQKNK